MKTGKVLKKETIQAAKTGYKSGIKGVNATSGALESVGDQMAKYGSKKLSNRKIVRDGSKAVVRVDGEVYLEDKQRFFDQQRRNLLTSDDSSLGGSSMFGGNSSFFADAWENEKKKARGNVLGW